MMDSGVVWSVVWSVACDGLWCGVECGGVWRKGHGYQVTLLISLNRYEHE